MQKPKRVPAAPSVALTPLPVDDVAKLANLSTSTAMTTKMERRRLAEQEKKAQSSHRVPDTPPPPLGPSIAKFPSKEKFRTMVAARRNSHRDHEELARLYGLATDELDYKEEVEDKSGSSNLSGDDAYLDVDIVAGVRRSVEVDVDGRVLDRLREKVHQATLQARNRKSATPTAPIGRPPEPSSTAQDKPSFAGASNPNKEQKSETAPQSSWADSSPTSSWGVSSLGLGGLSTGSLEASMGFKSSSWESPEVELERGLRALVLATGGGTPV